MLKVLAIHQQRQFLKDQIYLGSAFNHILHSLGNESPFVHRKGKSTIIQVSFMSQEHTRDKH